MRRIVISSLWAAGTFVACLLVCRSLVGQPGAASLPALYLAGSLAAGVIALLLGLVGKLPGTASRHPGLEREFRYHDGAVVRVGDRVRAPSGHPGVVEEIVPPGTARAQSLQSPRGGILIQEDRPGSAASTLVNPAEESQWARVELLGRAP